MDRVLSTLDPLMRWDTGSLAFGCSTGPDFEVAPDGQGLILLARRTGVSLASASQHAAVLRSAGLVATRRTGPAVLHTGTPLGKHLAGRP
jgi:hypothetical protein